MTGTHETILNFNDLVKVELRGDDLQDFDTQWVEVSISIREMPSDSILESLYRTQLKKSEELKTVLAMYDMELLQYDTNQSYQRSKTVFEKSLITSRKLATLTPGTTEHQQRAKVKGTISRG